MLGRDRPDNFVRQFEGHNVDLNEMMREAVRSGDPNFILAVSMAQQPGQAAIAAAPKGIRETGHPLERLFLERERSDTASKMVAYADPGTACRAWKLSRQIILNPMWWFSYMIRRPDDRPRFTAEDHDGMIAVQEILKRAFSCYENRVEVVQSVDEHIRVIAKFMQDFCAMVDACSPSMVAQIIEGREESDGELELRLRSSLFPLLLGIATEARQRIETLTMAHARHRFSAGTADTWRELRLPKEDLPTPLQRIFTECERKSLLGRSEEEVEDSKEDHYAKGGRKNQKARRHKNQAGGKKKHRKDSEILAAIYKDNPELKEKFK